MIVIDRKAPWVLELAWLVALLAELGHERAAIIIAREYLHSIVIVIYNEQEASMMVERQAHRIVEQAISVALLLGADRELDSSITIKRRVSHLFLFNLSLTHSQQQRDYPNPTIDQSSDDVHEQRAERHQCKRATRSNNQSTKERKNSTSHSYLSQPHPQTISPIYQPITRAASDSPSSCCCS